MKGQMIVELALVLPLMLAILGGMAGISFLYVSHTRMQNGIDVLAELASLGPSWRSAVPDENSRTDCNADPLEPEVTYPDGSAEPGDRILLTWTCHLETRWLFDGLPITVSSEAVLQPSSGL